MAKLDLQGLASARKGLPAFWYGTRQGRQTAVLLGAGSLATIWISSIVCWFLAPSPTAMWTTFALTGVGLVIYAWVFTVLAVASEGMVGMADANLDERQLSERRRVHTLAHRGTAWMLGLVLVVLASSGGADHVVRIPATALFLFLGAAFTTHLILPVLIAGWRLADPPPDDE